jgi:hypothetical protein
MRALMLVTYPARLLLASLAAAHAAVAQAIGTRHGWACSHPEAYDWRPDPEAYDQRSALERDRETDDPATGLRAAITTTACTDPATSAGSGALPRSSQTQQTQLRTAQQEYTMHASFGHGQFRGTMRSASSGDSAIIERTGSETVYLTDGVRLYRILGPIDDDNGYVIAIEDCRSLDVILVQADELHCGKFRAVAPAA